jgi:hypothetical protein
MDSLPPNHFDSLPGATRADVYQQLGLLCQLRRDGGHSEEQIAKLLGFHNAPGMYHQLKNWGLTGLVPQDAIYGAGAENVYSASPKARGTYKARDAGGERQPLPPIENAATIFRDTIATFEHYLEQSLSLKEYLQGQHFIGEGETEEDNIRELRGAQWHPHPHVVALIVTSIFAHQGDLGFVALLMSKLHPIPLEVNRKQLLRYIYGVEIDAKGGPQNRGDGLLNRANQIAAVIRGKPKVGRGVRGIDILPYEHSLALRVQSLIDKGFSREQVEQTFRDEAERRREDSLQSLHEEIEQVKSTHDPEYVAELENELRLVEGEKHDEAEFDRLWKLAKDLR